MHDLEEKLIEYGAIDNLIEELYIDDWFEYVRIVFSGKNKVGKVICILKKCYEINFKHDKTYSKSKSAEGVLDYKYFIQDIEIIEKEDFIQFKIDAWPLKGEVLCKDINIELR